jgi:hypothetical protein
VVPSGGIDRPQDEDAGIVLDHPARVARREAEIGDVAVLRIPRIDLAERAPDQLLVGADVAERRASERRRLDLGDRDARDAGGGHRRHAEHRAANPGCQHDPQGA